jgi:hypothetical protein
MNHEVVCLSVFTLCCPHCKFQFAPTVGLPLTITWSNCFLKTKYEFFSANRIEMIAGPPCSLVTAPSLPEYEDDWFLGCCAVYSGRRLPTFQICLSPPDHKGRKHLRNVGKLPDYTAQQPIRQSSSYIYCHEFIRNRSGDKHSLTGKTYH